MGWSSVMRGVRHHERKRRQRRRNVALVPGHIPTHMHVPRKYVTEFIWRVTISPASSGVIVPIWSRLIDLWANTGAIGAGGKPWCKDFMEDCGLYSSFTVNAMAVRYSMIPATSPAASTGDAVYEGDSYSNCYQPDAVAIYPVVIAQPPPPTGILAISNAAAMASPGYRRHATVPLAISANGIKKETVLCKRMLKMSYTPVVRGGCNSITNETTAVAYPIIVPGQSDAYIQYGYNGITTLAGCGFDIRVRATYYVSMWNPLQDRNYTMVPTYLQPLPTPVGNITLP